MGGASSLVTIGLAVDFCRHRRDRAMARRRTGGDPDRTHDLLRAKSYKGRRCRDRARQWNLPGGAEAVTAKNRVSETPGSR